VLTVVFALSPHERSPFSDRVVPVAVLALDAEDVKERVGAAEAVATVDLRVKVLKKTNINAM
jgi:hypothetical protein